jgi:hypothetical protein
MSQVNLVDFRGVLPTKQAVEDYIYAGHATITLQFKVSDLHFTYKITVKKGDIENNKRAIAEGLPQDVIEPVYFVKVLSGPNNETDYRMYLGSFRKTHGLKWSSTHSQVKQTANSFKAFSWFINAIQAVQNPMATMPTKLEVWHEDVCGRCGRKLTVPQSISDGFGPECIKMVA